MDTLTTPERIAKYLQQLSPHVMARDGAQLLQDALHEIDRLNLDREALMRRLFMAGEVFAEIEAHQDRAVSLARNALFGKTWKAWAYQQSRGTKWESTLVANGVLQQLTVALLTTRLLAR